MTGRERVLAAISHSEPDRTPLFERIIKSPHSDALLGRRCAATNFGLQMEMLAENAHAELCRRQARDQVDLAKLLGFDMIAAGANPPPPLQPPVRLGPRRWQLGDVVAEEMESGWVRYIYPPAPSPVPEEDLAQQTERWLDQPYVAPPHNPDEWIVFEEIRRILREEQLDLAIYCSAYAIPVCTLAPHQLEWLHTRPELMEGFYSRCTDGVLRLIERYTELGADVIGLGGDLASDAGPLISPACYRRFIVPQIRRQAEAVHRGGAAATNTSDGYLWPVLDDFLIGTGVDGYGEIDYAAGMDLARLKQQYGGRMFFLGNLDIRFVLTRGSVRECRDHMIECIEKGWGSGGHIIMTSNVVHEDVKLDNYLACIEAYREYFGL